MKHYVKPTIEHKPDAIILHVGTNELRKKKNEVQITEEIIGLAKSIEQEKISITVSGLIARSDPFEERRGRVNLILADMCFESKLRYIDHPNIDKTFKNKINRTLSRVVLKLVFQNNSAQGTINFILECFI